MPHAQSAFQRLVEALPNLVWTCRADGPCDYLSPQWVAYTGIPASEQLGSGWLQQIHPDDRAPTATAWAAAVTERRALDVAFRIRRHDGQYRWFQTRAVPEYDAAGTLMRWYGTNTDVQDLRDSESALAALNKSLESRIAEATAAARHVAEQLEVAQSITHTGSWRFDLQAQTVEWSDELFRILRIPISPQAPPFSTHHALFQPESWKRLQSAVERTSATGVGYELELALADSPDGPRYAIGRGEAERNDAGQIVALYGTFQDVTELVQTRLERDQAAERALLATSAADLGVWEWKITSGELVWNDLMYDLYGVPRGTPRSIGDWQDAVHPEDAPAIDQLVTDALASGSTLDFRFRLASTGGSERHLRTVARIIRADDGTPFRMIGINQDVTAEVLAEQMEERAADQLKAFIRNAPAAIAMLDRHYCYLEASDLWMSDYQLHRDEVLGRSHYDIFPHVPERWKLVHQRVLLGEVHRHEADPFPQPDGSVIWLQWEARPWYGADGAIGGLLFFTRDITLRMELQEALRLQTEELARSNKDLQEFAYAASHDLQEPLRAVAGCAQILQQQYRGNLDAQADELISHMVDGAQRMRQLIEDLLSYSRVGTHGGALEDVDAGLAVQEALRNLQHAVAETAASITVGPMPRVHADLRQLTQLLQNLIGNAIKYAGGRTPQIVVRAWRETSAWHFSVRDNGIGIPADARERIFQIFQRLHTRAEYPGTGVGLALCRRIVERHAGQIWVASTVGPGTDIRFTLARRS